MKFLDHFRSMSKLQMFFLLAVNVAAGLLLFAGHHDAAGSLMLANAPGAFDLDTLSREFASKASEFKSLGDSLKQAQTELQAKFDRGENASKELKETVDTMLSKFNGLPEQIRDLEQKLARGVEEQQKEAKSWGQQVAESDAYKGFKERGGQRGSFGMEVKQVTSAAAGGMIVSQRETEVLALPRERRVMRDLMTTIPISTSSVDYPVQASRTNNAAPVAEAAAKPYSDYAWTAATAPVRTIAHLAKLTRQALDDAPRLAGEVDSEMRYGLGYVEERQFLYGTGVGQNLHGIVPQATAFAKPAGFTDAKGTRIDVLRLAVLQVALGLIPADGIVLNDLDWALIELTKDDVGNYMLANPQGGSIGARMWNLPVVNTPAMAADDFLVGAFRNGATVYDRMGVEVLISTENDKDFENNLATMRAEERVAIAVKRPGVFVHGTFTAAIASVRA